MLLRSYLFFLHFFLSFQVDLVTFGLIFLFCLVRMLGDKSLRDPLRFYCCRFVSFIALTMSWMTCQLFFVLHWLCSPLTNLFSSAVVCLQCVFIHFIHWAINAVNLKTLYEKWALKNRNVSHALLVCFASSEKLPNGCPFFVTAMAFLSSTTNAA